MTEGTPNEFAKISIQAQGFRVEYEGPSSIIEQVLPGLVEQLVEKLSELQTGGLQ